MVEPVNGSVARSGRRIEMYDTTLRDGTQGAEIALTLADKLKLTRALDELGFDYIEGGYPLSNPKDSAYFEQVKSLGLKHAKVTAFGMTRRKGVEAKDDPGMRALVAAEAPIIAIVGKTWDLHVDEVLRVSHEENLAMIRDSVGFCAQAGSTEQVFYDAEHFFDGYKANPDYALATLKAALEGGATRLVLCDTNGGSLPDFIKEAVTAVRSEFGLGDSLEGASGPLLAIHVHNDGALAVANSMAALEAGCVQVQGTINGIGERCGNVDLIPIAANLRLKLGHDCLAEDAVPGLHGLAMLVYELAGMTPVAGQPYVGANAFTHKGGMHVHAVQRIAHSYEHVPPETVGNQRRVLVSELAGASNIAAQVGVKFGIEEDKATQRKVLEKIQDLEHEGYQFESAEASMELMVYEALDKRPAFWDLHHYRCVILKRDGDGETSTEGTVKLSVNDQTEYRVAEGDGPVNALYEALVKCLGEHYPEVRRIHLSDYKVRVVNPTAETAARVRVVIEFQSTAEDGTTRVFSTVGVDENIVEASWEAISDAFQYLLIETRAGVEC
ncbi:citramalate synthase [Mucisphaera sp.]|uniref:citramalate synthase n=1 Tax=Mucisphaera sp. TaxID=2913024 RepID=UPI003D0FBC10